jgi:hypothetical protein
MFSNYYHAIIVEMTNSAQIPNLGSLSQGAQFAEMTKSLHGGSRKNMRKNKKMVRRSSRKNMRGGSFFTPYADYRTEFNMSLPKDMADIAKIAPLDAKFEELPAVERAAGVMIGGSRRRSKSKSKSKKSSRSRRSRSMKAGSRKSRNSRKSKSKSRKSKKNKRKNMKGGSAPVDQPSMLIQNQAEEMDARLNPQWYTENTVIPNFRGPLPIPGGTTPAPLAPAPPSPKLGGWRR